MRHSPLAVAAFLWSSGIVVCSAASSSSSAAAAATTPSSSLREGLRRRYPRDDITVVFSDSKYVPFALNNRESFRRNDPAAQYLAVGMDEETVRLFRAHEAASTDGGEGDGNSFAAAESALFSDILDQGQRQRDAHDADATLSDLGKLRCARLDVVSRLQDMGYNVLLLDSDVSVTSRFDSSYFASLGADFVSGHGTFPRFAYDALGFALQSGMYYVRSSPGGRALIADAAARCRRNEDGQVALNAALMDAYSVRVPADGNDVMEKDEWNTVVYDAVPKTTSRTRSNGSVAAAAAMRIGVLGKEYFPSGCKFVGEASEDAWIRHPECFPRSDMSDEERIDVKEQSLRSMGGWYLPESSQPDKDTETKDFESTTTKTTKKKWTKRHKAVLWSFPGSGNTMLRYTFESITGQPGSTNAIYTDKRLVPVLPGEGNNDGKLVKIHPAQDILNPIVIRRKADAYAQSDARVILMRDPYDAIWSWYQLVQTGSHSGRIRERDFNVDHFRRAALRWATLFRRAVEEEYMPYMEGNSPDKTFLIKFEDLVKNQDNVLRDMLSFLDEEVAVDGPLTVRDHPIVKRDPATDDTVPKSSAYNSQELIDAMWSIMGPSAERFGYVKPSAPPSFSSSSSSSSLPAALLTDPLPQKGRSSSRGYLTYTPSGGLTNQLMELEVAVRYALESGRTLLLPPVLSTPVKIFPDIWTDDKDERRCTAETRSAEAPELSYDELDTIPWDEIIDVAQLSKRVPLVTSLPPDEYEGLSRLSLLKYHKCNTRWTDRKLSKGENCLPEHVPSGTPDLMRDGPVKMRSLDCAFQFTRGVDLLNMGAIFGTYASASSGGVYVFPRVQFGSNVHDAALRAVRHIRDEVSPEGSYLCAHLRLAGSEWEDYSPFQSGMDDAVAAARSFLAEKDPSGIMPLYVATDNEDAVRTKTDLCDGGRLCLFASDFSDLTSSMGLGQFQQIVPFEYLTCASADDVIATSGGRSSFGWLITKLHDERARQQHKVHLTSSLQLAPPSSVVSSTAAATAAKKSQAAKKNKAAKEQQAAAEAAVAAMRERQADIEKNQAAEYDKRHQAAAAKKRLAATATAQQRRAVASSASVHNPMHSPQSNRALRGKTKVARQRHYQKEQQLEVRTKAKEVSGVEHKKKSIEEKKYAYVSLLGWNPDASQRATYATATRALVHFLKDMGTRADIVVMIPHNHPRDAALEESLRSDGAIVVPVDPIIPPSPDMGGAAANFEPWFVELVLGKLSALRLTEYDRIQFLDTDVVLLKNTNLDAMFERFPGTDLVMEGLGPESPVRAGWFMVRPSEDAFENMATTLRRGHFTRDRGWDELGLPVDYPGWKGDVAKHTDKWGFYGAALEQGLLYHHYYALPKSRALSSADADVDAAVVEDGGLLEILDDRKMQSLGMVHCYGKLKPWNAGLDLTGVAQVYSVARERWNGVVASISFASASAGSEGAAANLVYKSPMRTVTSSFRRRGEVGRRGAEVRREGSVGTDRVTAAMATNNKEVHPNRELDEKRPSLEVRRAPQGHFERSQSPRRLIRGRALQGGDEDKAIIDHAEFKYNFADYRVAPRAFDESGLAEYSYAEGGFADYAFAEYSVASQEFENGAFAEYAVAENGFSEYSIMSREFENGAYAEYAVPENSFAEYGFAEYSVALREFEDGTFAEYSNSESGFAEYSIAPRTFEERLDEYDYSSGTEGVDRRARALQADDHKYMFDHAEFEYDFSAHAGAPRAYDESGLAEYSYAENGFADYSLAEYSYTESGFADYSLAEYSYVESGFADYSVAPREYDDGAYAEYAEAESGFADYSVAPREYDNGAYAEYAEAESGFADYSLAPREYNDGAYAEYAVADGEFAEYSIGTGDIAPN